MPSPVTSPTAKAVTLSSRGSETAAATVVGAVKLPSPRPRATEIEVASVKGSRKIASRRPSPLMSASWSSRPLAAAVPMAAPKVPSPLPR